MNEPLPGYRIFHIAMVDLKIINRTLRHLIIIPVFSFMFLYILKDRPAHSMLPYILAISLSYNFCTMFNRQGDDFNFYRISPVTSGEFIAGKNWATASINLLCAVSTLVIVNVFSGRTSSFMAESILLMVFIFISTLSTGNSVSLSLLERGTGRPPITGYLLVSLTVVLCYILFNILDELTGLVYNLMICFFASLAYYLITLKRTTHGLDGIMKQGRELN